MTERADIEALLPLRMQRMFQVIERAIGDGSSARVTELDLRAQGCDSRFTKQIGLLADLGLLEIEYGAQRRRIFHLSNRWRMFDEATVRAAIEARGLKDMPTGHKGKLP